MYINKDIDDYYNVVRSNIKKYRHIRGYTQEKLAELSGYSVDYIQQIESLKKNKYFSYKFLIIISIVLNVDLNDLVT